jgi:hypothetical protein
VTRSRRRRWHRQFRDYHGNPLSTGQKVAIVGAAAAVVGLIGYFVYEQQQTTAPGGAVTLGSGGSTTPLPATTPPQTQSFASSTSPLAVPPG